jgi:hypothetical protein
MVHARTETAKRFYREEATADLLSKILDELGLGHRQAVAVDETPVPFAKRKSLVRSERTRRNTIPDEI